MQYIVIAFALRFNYIVEYFFITPNLGGNMEAASKAQAVQMRLQPRTLKAIEHLAELTNTTNKTQIVATSVLLAESIVANVKSGAKIYIEQKDGTKQLLHIIGI